MVKSIFSTIIVACSMLFCGSNLNAQELFKTWAVGIEAGTYGPGITVATSLSSHFKLKAGVDYLNLKYNSDFNISPEGYLDNIPAGANIPEGVEVPEDAKISLSGTVSNPQLKFANFKAIVDYYPMENGIFSVSAGFYAGNNSIAADAKINDYQKLVDLNGGPIIFDLEDVVIKPNADGSFDGKIKFGNTIKPYFGIGLGRTIAKGRVGFKFDLGLIYQGSYQFESENVTVSKQAMGEATQFIEGAPSWLLKSWPVLNFSLSYRIF